MIADGRTLTGGHLDRWVQGVHIQGAALRFGQPPGFDQVAEMPPLPARVHHGLWIVDCPCTGAEMVWLGHPIVWCASCGNRYCGGLWRQVAIPDQRAEIERVLGERPFPVNQNWLPGESIEQLEAENRALL